jgi:hypothetical protein
MLIRWPGASDKIVDAEGAEKSKKGRRENQDLARSRTSSPLRGDGMCFVQLVLLFLRVPLWPLRLTRYVIDLLLFFLCALKGYSDVLRT